MKSYAKLGITALLAAALCVFSGFRAQTIIHDDGSETQDVLKVSDTAEGQKVLRSDADEFQKRNYTIMDYDNVNGEGFRAMKTITKEGANRSSVDRIVHKTYDGVICSTYYINYTFGSGSIEALRLGEMMEENDADLEYIVSFPSGTDVTSNSTTADELGSTYMWSLKESAPSQIYLQATVWHKLEIYLALAAVVVILLIVLLVERRRRSVISWKQAAQLRRTEMMLLCIPVVILGFMAYEYYAGTRITAQSLERLSSQQQEELLESRQEDKRIQDADAQRQRSGEQAAEQIRKQTADISASLRELARDYQAGALSGEEARAQADALAARAKDMLAHGESLSQADQDVLHQLVDRLVAEAETISAGTASGDDRKAAVSEEQRRADALGRDRQEKDDVPAGRNGSARDDVPADSDAAADEEAADEDEDRGEPSGSRDRGGGDRPQQDESSDR